ncbi:hypothetical protein N8508_00145 [bacterium]|nr:hypothetical protein [bacterium]
MKIDLNQVLKDIDGTVMGASEVVAVVNEKNNFIVNNKGQKITTTIPSKKEPTLKSTLISALLSNVNHDNKDKEIEPTEKAKRYALFFKINNATDDKIELEASEVVHLEELLWALEPTLIAGQCKEMINKK